MKKKQTKKTGLLNPFQKAFLKNSGITRMAKVFAKITNKKGKPYTHAELCESENKKK